MEYDHGATSSFSEANPNALQQHRAGSGNGAVAPSRGQMGQQPFDGMGGFPGMGDPAQMMKMMQYLPKLLSTVAIIPGILFGAIMTILYYAIYTSTSYFTLAVAPVAGFHLLLFMMAGELYDEVKKIQEHRRRWKLEDLQRDALRKDIEMRFRSHVD